MKYARIFVLFFLIIINEEFQAPEQDITVLEIDVIDNEDIVPMDNTVTCGQTLNVGEPNA